MLCDFFGDNQTYQENLLLKYYRKFEIDVVIVASTIDNILKYYSNDYDPSSPKKIYINEEGGKIYRLPYKLNFLNKLRKFPDVDKILKTEKPDLIYCHGVHLNLKEAVDYKKKYKHTKIILDSHGDYSNSANNWLSKNILNKIFRRLFLKKHAQYVSKFYAVVPEGIKFMHEMYGIPQESIELLPLGCDYEYMQEVKKNTDVKALKEKFHISDDDFVIISGGKFNPLKRTEILMEAVNLLPQKKIKLLIFGTPDKNHLEYYKNIEKLAEKENIHLLGWLSADEIYKVMSVADIAVFPASQSVLWQQSIGMGLPLIAGDSGMQNMSYLNVNENLIRVEEKNINPNYFSKLIESLIESPEKLAVMKTGAEKTASDFLNYKRIAEKTLRLE